MKTNTLYLAPLLAALMLPSVALADAPQAGSARITSPAIRRAERAERRAVIRQRVGARVRNAMRSRPASDHWVVPQEMHETIVRNGVEVGVGNLPAAERAQVLASRQTLHEMNALTRQLRATRRSPRALAARIRGIFAGGAINRETSDANFTSSIPGTLELSETDTETSVDSARRAHSALQVQYDVMGRQGFNLMASAPTGKLLTTVRYGHMDNAYADGTRMVIGAGGGPKGLFKDLTLGPDVQWHEVSHNMTQHVFTKLRGVRAGVGARREFAGMSRGDSFRMLARTYAGRLGRNLRGRLMGGGLNYRNQSGALNEATSDINAAMIMHSADGKKLGQLGEIDFLIGHNIMNDGINGAEGHPVALRNMMYPGTGYDSPLLGRDKQPKDMDGFDPKFPSDNGGVHRFSSIPNRAFTIATMELAKVMPDATTEATTGAVWNHALMLLGPNATFSEAAEATIRTSHELFPNDPQLAQTIANAYITGWRTVKVPFSATSARESAGRNMRGTVRNLQRQGAEI